MNLTIWRIEYDYEDTTIHSYGEVAFLITDGGAPPADDIANLLTQQNPTRTYTIKKIRWLRGEVLVFKHASIPSVEGKDDEPITSGSG